MEQGADGKLTKAGEQLIIAVDPSRGEKILTLVHAQD